MNRMKIKTFLLLNSMAAALALSLSASAADASTNSPAPEFKNDPDKSMAAAHESFIKGDTKKAAADIDSAAAYIKKQSDKVGESSKAGMKKAGDELDKLGDGIKNGTVKSGDEMKKTFAKVDHQVASCWHKTAADSKSAGKDTTAALKKAGNALQNSAKWSGQQIGDGTQASINAMRKAGKATGDAAKASADEVDKWFKDIGDGIDNLGKKL